MNVSVPFTLHNSLPLLIEKLFKVLSKSIRKNCSLYIFICELNGEEFDFDQINFSLQNLNSKTITVPKIQEIDTQVLLSCFLNIKNDIKNDKFKSFTCNNNLKQEITIELIKRLHKPIFIPLTVLFSCFLILYSKNEKNYKIKTNSIFMIVFFLLVYSEVSVQYFTTTINLTILYFVLPVLIFIIGYFLFNRLVKNV